MGADDEPEVPGYALHDILARSERGSVHRATQLSADRPVAVRVLGTGLLDATATSRLREEVGALGVLADHPHVLGLVDAGATTAGAPFVAMDLVTAGSIGDRLRAFGPMTPTDVARVGAEVADALEAAHAVGIVHGHITPDDVLVGRRGRTLLADFGLPSIDRGRPVPAPEVGRGGPPTPAADVFALGATLYTMATGRPATGADRLPLPPEVPFPLVDVIETCLAVEPDDRPALADVATRLEAVAAGTAGAPTSVAVPDPPDEPVVSGPRRGPDPRPSRVDGPASFDGADPEPASPVPGAPAPGTPSTRSAPDPAAFPARRHVVVAVLIALSILAAVVLALLT